MRTVEPISVTDRSTAPTVVEIDLSAIAHNARLVQKMAAPASVMAVVKADAYGHGAVRVSRKLVEEGIDYFAVATLAEAEHLRKHDIREPMLVMAAPLPGSLPAYRKLGVDVNVCSPAIAREVLATADPSAPLHIHVKVDTGMSRLGLMPEEAPDILSELQAAPGVHVSGLWSHYATADSASDTFSKEQLAIFDDIVRTLKPPYPMLHIGHSSGIFSDRVTSKLMRSFNTYVRPGISLYGVASSTGEPTPAELKPAMRFLSRITQIKDIPTGTTVSYGRTWTATQHTRLAIVGAGYADGYPRALSNRGRVGIDGGLYPVVGRVCMDMIMINLGKPTKAPPVAPGDEVVLFGPGGPSLTDVASWADTIPYELCSRIGLRVPKLHI